MKYHKLLNLPSFRQSTTPGDGVPSSVRLTNTLRASSRSSTNLLIGSDHVAGPTPFPGNLSPPVQPRRINVVLFGETGVGKSSVINLIAQKDVARVSSDVNGCTMQSTPYDISFDGMNFTIFDTIGLEEPQMGVNGYLKAIEKAYELIMKLGAAGGVHLLLFCMRGGRITATTQSNYRLFCECLCSTKVPIALVFTGLEREVEMEDWWERNKTHIDHYGIKSNYHACITAVKDDTPEEVDKYNRSQTKIRDVLIKCAREHKAFCPEQHSWFARVGRGMRSFIEKHKNPKKKDIMRVLTRRCKLDPETAKKIADMMEKGETEAKESKQEECAEEDNAAEGGADPAAGKDVVEDTVSEDNSGAPKDNAAEGVADPPAGKDVVGDTVPERNDSGASKENAAEGGADPAAGEDTKTHLHNDIEPVRPPVWPEGNKSTNDKAAHLTLAYPQNDVEPRRPTVGLEKDKAGASNEKAAKLRASAPPQMDVETVSHPVGLERKDKYRVADEKVAHPPLAHPQHGVEPVRPTVGLEGKDNAGASIEKAAKLRASAPSQTGVETVSHPVGLERKDKYRVADEKVAHPPLAHPQHGVEPVRPTVGLEGKDNAGASNEKAAKLRASTLPQMDVEPIPPTITLDKSGTTSEKPARRRTTALSQNDVGAGPPIVGLEGKDKSKVANEKAAKRHTSTAPRNDVGFGLGNYR